MDLAIFTSAAFRIDWGGGSNYVRVIDRRSESVPLESSFEATRFLSGRTASQRVSLSDI